MRDRVYVRMEVTEGKYTRMVRALEGWHGMVMANSEIELIVAQ